jgi:hypothetical protein
MFKFKNKQKPVNRYRKLTMIFSFGSKETLFQNTGPGDAYRGVDLYFPHAGDQGEFTNNTGLFARPCPEPVEINIPTSCHGGIIEKAKFIASENRQTESHVQRVSKLSEVLIIGAVKEGGFTGSIISFCHQVERLVSDCSGHLSGSLLFCGFLPVHC